MFKIPNSDFKTDLAFVPVSVIFLWKSFSEIPKIISFFPIFVLWGALEMGYKVITS